jgi:glutamine synthetase
MLKTALEGIKQNLKPPEPVEENVYQFDDESLAQKQIEVLPTSLREALNYSKETDVIKKVLGSHLFERYIAIKTKEWSEFKTQVTAWEIEKYLDIY